MSDRKGTHVLSSSHSKWNASFATYGFHWTGHRLSISYAGMYYGCLICIKKELWDKRDLQLRHTCGFICSGRWRLAGGWWSFATCVRIQSLAGQWTTEPEPRCKQACGFEYRRNSIRIEKMLQRPTIFIYPISINNMCCDRWYDGSDAILVLVQQNTSFRMLSDLWYPWRRAA